MDVLLHIGPCMLSQLMESYPMTYESEQGCRKKKREEQSMFPHLKILKALILNPRFSQDRTVESCPSPDPMPDSSAQKLAALLKQAFTGRRKNALQGR